jgi:hypothetical protein
MDASAGTSARSTLITNRTSGQSRAGQQRHQGAHQSHYYDQPFHLTTLHAFFLWDFALQYSCLLPLLYWKDVKVS